MNVSRKVLIVDGNTAATNSANRQVGGQGNAEQYAAVLQRLAPGLSIVAVHPAEDGPDCLPEGCALTDFSGIAWTGSALNVYEHTPAVRHQLTLAERAWRSGVPNFGSCWGLQVFATVLGGRVAKNPRGREVGVARCIYLSPAGCGHAMFDGKPLAFEALAVHTDEIVEAPPGAVLLASNSMSQWQALAIEAGASQFWGVQYHPEMDLGVLAVIITRYGERLVEAGLFEDLASLRETAAQWRQLHADPSRTDLGFRYGMGRHILDPAVHQNELRNWLAGPVGCEVVSGPTAGWPMNVTAEVAADSAPA